MSDTDVKDYEDQVSRNKVRIHISVNFKPVIVTKARLTGIEIKEAAIAQGVNIKLDFILFEDRGQGHRVVIGDSDVVHVHDGSKFEAIPHDDNS